MFRSFLTVKLPLFMVFNIIFSFKLTFGLFPVKTCFFPASLLRGLLFIQSRTTGARPVLWAQKLMVTRSWPTRGRIVLVRVPDFTHRATHRVKFRVRFQTVLTLKLVILVQDRLLSTVPAIMSLKLRNEMVQFPIVIQRRKGDCPEVSFCRLSSVQSVEACRK